MCVPTALASCHRWPSVAWVFNIRRYPISKGRRLTSPVVPTFNVGRRLKGMFAAFYSKHRWPEVRWHFLGFCMQRYIDAFVCKPPYEIIWKQSENARNVKKIHTNETLKKYTLTVFKFVWQGLVLWTIKKLSDVVISVFRYVCQDWALTEWNTLAKQKSGYGVWKNVD